MWKIKAWINNQTERFNGVYVNLTLEGTFKAACTGMNDWIIFNFGTDSI